MRRPLRSLSLLLPLLVALPVVALPGMPAAGLCSPALPDCPAAMAAMETTSERCHRSAGATIDCCLTVPADEAPALPGKVPASTAADARADAGALRPAADRAAACAPAPTAAAGCGRYKLFSALLL